MKKLLSIFAVVSVITGLTATFDPPEEAPYFAPPTSYDTTFTGAQGNAWNAMVNLPSTYYTTQANDSFQCIVYLPGNGETMQDGGVTLMDNFGPHYWLRQQGWNGEVTLPNGTHKVIYISLQLPFDWTNPVTGTTNSRLKPKLDAIMSRYRIKRQGLHLMGISAGAGTLEQYAVYQPTAGDDSYIRSIQSIVSVQTRTNTTAGQSVLPYPRRFGHAAVIGLRALAFHQQSDGTNFPFTWAANMRDSVAGSATNLVTSYGSGGHSNFNDFFQPGAVWTTAGNSEVTSVTGPAVGGDVYQWALLQGDTSFSTGLSSLNGYAGADFAKIYSFNNTLSFALNGTVNNGPATTHSWTRVAGPGTVTITNGSTQNATVSNITHSGHHAFKYTVSDGVTTHSDTVVVWVRNLMERGIRATRVGPKQKYSIGGSIISGRVTTTEISIPWITRDNVFPGIMAGDTIEIKRNPNNNGQWNKITIGDISGNPETPIVIVSDSLIDISTHNSSATGSNALFIANSDSNTFSYIKWDGLAHRTTKGVKYGIRIGNRHDTDTMFMGIAANYAHHIEMSGFDIEMVGVGIIWKTSSGTDSTNPYAIYDNFRFVGNSFNDMRFSRIHGECIYYGHTDPAGNQQAGNDGPTCRGDSVTFNRIIIDRTGWDGMQFSNTTNVLVKNTLIYKSGLSNQSSHDFGGFIGGYSSGTFDSIVVINNTGAAVGFLGQGRATLSNSILDSAEVVIYCSQALADEPPPHPDTLQIYIENNIIARSFVTDVKIRIDDNSPGGEWFKPGAIRNNLFVDDRDIEDLIDTDYGDTIANNTVIEELDLDTSTHKDLLAYRMYNLVISAPDSSWSYFDLEGPPANIPPVANAGTDQTISIPDVDVIVSGSSSSDEDGSVVSYSWTKTSGPSQFNIVSANTASTTINNLTEGVYVFQLQVTDDDGATHTDQVTITVLANVAPSANAGNDQTITLPTSSVSVSGSGSADSDGSIVTYAWTKTSGPSTYTIVSPSSSSTNITGLVEGVYQFTLTVTDNGGLTDEDVVQITVNAAPPANIPPTADAGSNITITLPVDSVDLDGTGTDSDGSIAAYLWTKISGGSATIVSSTSADTRVKNLTAGTYVFQLKVADDDGAETTDLVTVIVQSPPPVTPIGTRRFFKIRRYNN